MDNLAGLDDGKRLGIAGTPEFSVGYLDPNHPGELKCIRRLSGEFQGGNRGRASRGS